MSVIALSALPSFKCEKDPKKPFIQSDQSHKTDKSDSTWKQIAKNFVPNLDKSDYSKFLEEWSKESKQLSSASLKGNADSSYIMWEDNKQRITYTHTQAFKERFQISDSLFQSAQKEDSLKDLTASRLNILEDYMEIFHLYKEDNKGELYIKKTKESIRLTGNKLMKVVCEIFKNEFNQFGNKLGYTGMDFLIDERRYVAKAQLNKMQIFRFGSMRSLGKGAFGSVDKILNITEGAYQAFKRARRYTGEKSNDLPAKQNRAERCILHEAAVLEKIAAFGLSQGFQSPPTAIVNFIGTDNVPIAGFLGPIYLHTVSDWMRKSHVNFSSRIKCCTQLLTALHTMSKFDIQHGDLTTKNIFVNTEKETTFHIADWGSARIGTLNAGDLHNIHTAKYMSSYDYEHWWKIKHSDKKPLQTAMLQRDVFAMGTVLFRVITGGQFPYPFDESDEKSTGEVSDFPQCDAVFDFKALVKAGCKIEYATVISKMVIQKFDKRPSIESIYKDWMAIK